MDGICMKCIIVSGLLNTCMNHLEHHFPKDMQAKLVDSKSMELWMRIQFNIYQFFTFFEVRELIVLNLCNGCTVTRLVGQV